MVSDLKPKKACDRMAAKATPDSPKDFRAASRLSPVAHPFPANKEGSMHFSRICGRDRWGGQEAVSGPKAFGRKCPSTDDALKGPGYCQGVASPDVAGFEAR